MRFLIEMAGATRPGLYARKPTLQPDGRSTTGVLEFLSK